VNHRGAHLARPALVIHIPYEGVAELRLIASTAEDEHALRIWLRRSRSLRELPDSVIDLLDALDGLDFPRAA
jgi:hypothetical protein